MFCLLQDNIQTLDQVHKVIPTSISNLWQYFRLWSCQHKQPFCWYFLNCYLAAPLPTLGHYRGGSLTQLMLITCVLHTLPEGHQEPCNKVGSIRLAEHLVGFEPGTFWFWSQHFNSLLLREVDIISIIIKTSGIKEIVHIDIAVGSPCVVPSDDCISVPPIIDPHDCRV